MDEQETQGMEQDEMTQSSAAPEETMAEPSVPEAAAVKSAMPIKMTPKLAAILAGVVFVIAAAGGYYLWHERTAASGNAQAAASLDSVTYPAVVATVNGEDIPGSELKKSVKQTENIAEQQGANLSDASVQNMIQDQSLSLLINSTLLVQAAKKDNLAATKDDVDKQYKDVEDQFGGADALNAQMQKDGLTEADLRKNIEEQLIIKAYLEKQPSYANATVTESDIQTAYDSYKAQYGTSTPALDQISSQIKDQLIQQKQQDAINGILDALRASSTIKTNVEFKVSA